MIIIEPTKKNHEHLQVNAAFINLILATGIKDVAFYAEEEYGIQLKRLLGETKFKWHSIRVRGSARKFDYPLHLVQQIQSILTALSAPNADGKAVVLSIDPLARLFFSILFNFRFRRAEIYMFYHGELEYLERCTTAAQLVFFKMPLWANIKFRSDRVKNIVLSEGIKDELNSRGNKGLLESFLLPYSFSNVEATQKSKVGLFVVGLPGVAAARKGSHHVFELADSLAYRESEIEFRIIGRNDMLEKTPPIHRVKIVSQKAGLSVEEYEKNMHEIDIALYLYGTDSYLLTASGAVFDAIRFEKPIVALRNAFFDELWAVAGDIGVLCNSVEEIAVTIEVFSKDRQRLSLYAENMGRAKKELETIYRQSVKKIFFCSPDK
ncbi:MAG TPA: hypothetical protein VMW10_02090 [Alphaproteobacteria bacterium]|nr:hypothetical protein [Alphaproteobacteria bacterium]